MAVLQEEPGAEQVRDIVYGHGTVLLPFLVLMECEYKLLTHQPQAAEESLLFIEAWPVEVVESDYEWRRRAAEIKSHGRISFADAWVAALALLRDAELVHRDPEFDAVAGLKAVRLPYNRRSRS